ncbi:hypothetical protein ABK040_016275 [Willaertia magna]
MFLNVFKRNKSNNVSFDTVFDSNSTKEREFTFVISINSIDNVPLYFQAPISIDLKLNNKIVGSTPFKVVESSTNQIKYNKSFEFLVVIGKENTLTLSISKTTNLKSKPEVIIEKNLDLTKYCFENHEHQAKESLNVEILEGVNVVIQTSIFSVIGNSLSSSGGSAMRRAASLDFPRLINYNIIKETNEDKSKTTPTSPNTISPTKELGNEPLSSSPPIVPIMPTNQTNPSTPTTPNNSNNPNSPKGGSSLEEFFKKRDDMHKRRVSSPVAYHRHTHHNTSQPQEINPYEQPVETTVNSPNNYNYYLHSGTTPPNSDNTEALQLENNQLKMVLSRARDRILLINNENQQLKDRVRVLEDQVKHLLSILHQNNIGSSELLSSVNHL